MSGGDDTCTSTSDINNDNNNDNNIFSKTEQRVRPAAHKSGGLLGPLSWEGLSHPPPQ